MSWDKIGAQVVDFGKSTIQNLNIAGDNGQQVLSAILYRRVVYGLEAVRLLVENKIFTEARIQRRGILEALFVLGALWHQPDTVVDFVNNDVHRRIKIYTNLKKTSAKFRSHHFKNLSNNKIDEIINDLKRQKSGSYLSLESLSQKAGLHDLYLSDYCVLSSTAHHLTKDLERHIAVDEYNNIIEFVVEDDATSEADILYPSVDQCIMASYAINEIFNLGLKETINKLSNIVNKTNK
jgi:hypothetical protein